MERPLQMKITNDDVRANIASAFWGVVWTRDKRSMNCRSLEPYFEYYKDQAIIALHEGGIHISVQSHEDICVVIGALKSAPSRIDLITNLIHSTPNTGSNHSSEKIEGSIDFAIRLLTMIDVGHIPNSWIGRRPILWESGSVQNFLKEEFPDKGKLLNERVKLEKLFVALNFERIAGIKIQWTTNLANHMRMMGDDSEVAIFNCASFLQTAKDSDIFPSGFIEETIRTLRLLFPQSDPSTQKWSQKLSRVGLLDPATIQCGKLRAEDRQIDSFNYWRDRIVILKQVFDESKPRSWSQWWFDRRNSSERYPVLLAAAALVLTALFGFIQCIEGALQSFKAYHPTAN